MLAATNGVDSGAGVLHVVKNYTGDVMNFEMAAEMAAAGTGVEVFGGDQRRRRGRGQPLYRGPPRGGRSPCWSKRSPAPRPRGPAAAAVAEIARKVNANGRSMGMALTSCTVPAAGKPTFDLPEGEMEIGHRHPRRARPPPRTGPRGRRDRRDAGLADPLRPRLHRRRRDRLRQRMGASPLIELYVMYHEVARILGKSGIPIARSLVGPYITRPRHGRLLGHPGAGGRRDPAVVGRAGAYARAAVGSLADERQRRRSRPGCGSSPG